MSKYKIAVIVGSLRKESFNRKMARELIAMAPDTLSMEILEIGDLPLYSEDLDSSPPDSWKRLRQQVRDADGVLFLTPEYNRSVPGVLKNAIDIASRPYGQNSWDGKPGGVMSVSISPLGAFGANHHLRQSLVFVNVPCMQQPEGYISDAGDLFDEQGKVKNVSTREFSQTFINAFADWVSAHAGKRG